MASVFTKIIDGELPGRFVWKDDRAVAFLSINPITTGHTLVVPRQEVDHFLDLDDDLWLHLSQVTKHVGDAIQRAFDPPRVGTMIAGFEVPHCHVHVLQIADLGDLSFDNAATDPDPDEMDRAAEQIRAALRDLGHDEVAGD
ncbi:MAG: HIT family protein [Nitriliruptorales bacterium]|nr:HIT family protein [Nitriliruptorales bacterium]